MKIALDLTFISPSFGGGKEKVISNIIDGFFNISSNIELIIFCYDNAESKVKKIVKKADYIIFKRNLFLNKNIQNLYIRTFKFYKYLKSVDILFFPDKFSGFCFFQIPTIVLPHDIQFKRNPPKNIIIHIMIEILYYMDFFLRQYVIAISEFDKGEMRKFYPRFSSKIVRIYNPVKINKTINFIPFNDYKDEIILLSINIKDKHKNIITLLKAIQLIPTKYNIKLYLVGEISEKKRNFYLNKYNKFKNIYFFGYLPQDKLYELLYNTDIYITPSKYEGFGMTAVEAMMCLVPVLSSNHDALKEVTFNSAYYYKNYNNEVELAKKIIEMLQYYPTKDYLLNMKNKAIYFYNYKTISRQYLVLFQSIMYREY